MSNGDFYHKATLPHLPLDEPIAIPKTIGPYPIQRLLEKGGMSLLFLGIDPDTQESATIKVLSKKYLSHKEVVQRFFNEAEIIAMTNHPNIVKMLKHGEWEGGLYIAMEYIKGVSLRQYLLQHPISLRKAIQMILETAYAICHLHVHGVIHRDLKPENILVSDSGVIKVIDFGIAQILDAESKLEQPLKSQVIGTPVYISPEQKADPESVGFMSDIYSLGIISYEMILGKLSHGKIHLSLMPKGLQPILRKALMQNPQERYRDIVDFITDISSYLNSPQIDQDTKVHDQISDISDEIIQVQGALLAPVPENWSGLDIGIERQQSIGISTLWYDFFHLSDGSKLLLFGEPAAKGVEGMVTTALLRGMIHALMPGIGSLEELMAIVNSLLIQDPVAGAYTLTALVFPEGKNQFLSLSMGSASFFLFNKSNNSWEKLSSKHPALGVEAEVDFQAMPYSFNPGDTLVLHTFGVPIKLPKENLEIDAHKIAQRLLYGSIEHGKKLPTGRPIAIVCIKKL